MRDRLIYGGLGRLVDYVAGRTPPPLSRTLQGLRAEFDLLRCHRRGVAAATERYDRASGLRLHLGCGDTRKPGWVNIDTHRGDLTLDLRMPLPFRDGSCAAIYSEHFLEHVDYPDATLRLLGECRRVLQPGGLFDIGVPDTEWPLLEYAGVSQEGYSTWRSGCGIPRGVRRGLSI
jgi:SAM-dependent methyltransferase